MISHGGFIWGRLVTAAPRPSPKGQLKDDWGSRLSHRFKRATKCMCSPNPGFHSDWTNPSHRFSLSQSLWPGRTGVLIGRPEGGGPWWWPPPYPKKVTEGWNPKKKVGTFAGMGENRCWRCEQLFFTHISPSAISVRLPNAVLSAWSAFPFRAACLNLSWPFEAPDFLFHRFNQSQGVPEHSHFISSSSSWTTAPTGGPYLGSPLDLCGSHLWGCQVTLAFLGPYPASSACYWRSSVCLVELNRTLKRTSCFQTPSSISRSSIYTLVSVSLSF